MYLINDLIAQSISIIRTREGKLGYIGSPPFTNFIVNYFMETRQAPISIHSLYLPSTL